MILKYSAFASCLIYDNLDRLSSVEYLDDTTDTEAFTMDLLGNRTNVNLRDGNDQAYTVNNANNRYTAVASNSLTYDNAGNTTTDQNDHTYTYDYENRIETITRPSDSSTIVTYTGACPSKPLAGNALGRRIKMVDAITPADSRLYYFSDNWQVLEEYTVAAVPARTAYYVWGNYIDELLFIWNGGNSLAAHALQGHLFSTVALVDVTDGTVLERCEYNAYGKATVYTNMNDWQTGTPPTTQNYSAYGNPYLFTGRRLDTLDSGSFATYYYRNRYYDADTGRFLQKDPLGVVPGGDIENPFKPHMQYWDGMNAYLVLGANPITNTDPYGLMSMNCCRANLHRWFRDPWIINYSRFSKREGCLKSIRCVKSCGGASGLYNFKTREISLCADKITVAKFGNVLKHEIVHSISLCGDKCSSCSDCMEEEKFAYYKGRGCSRSGTPQKGCSDSDITAAAWGSCAGYCPSPPNFVSMYWGINWPPKMPK